MRRRIETKIMAAFLACVMTAGMTADCIGVYADESNAPVVKSVQEMTDHENDIELYDGLLYDSDDFVSDKKKEYHDNEVTKIEEKTESVQEMEKQVEKAQKAASDAADAVEDLKEAIDELQEQASNAEAAAEEISATDVTAAKDEATNASTAVEQVYENGMKVDDTVSSYNEKVDEDQKAINSLTEKKTEEDGAVSVDEIIAPSEEDASVSNLVKRTEEYAATAQEEADNAKAALEAALAVESDEINEEIEKNVKLAVDAAVNAAEAADAAEDLYENSLTALENAIKEYNLYAMAYGMPLYGETEVTYLDADGNLKEEAKKQLIEAGLISEDGKTQKDIAEDIEGTVSSVEEIVLDDTNIRKAEGELATAKENLNTAKEAAEEAIESIAEASGAIDAAVSEADEASGKVKDYYVNPAEKQVENTQEKIETKESDIEGLKQDLADKEAAIRASEDSVRPAKEEEYKKNLESKEEAMNSADTSMKSAQSTYDKALKAYEAANSLQRLFNKNNVSTNYNNAKEALNKAKSDYSTAKKNYENYRDNRASLIDDMIAGDATVIANKNSRDQVQKDIETANSELTALNNQKAEDEKALETAKNTRDAYIAAAGDKATQEFLDSMAKILKENSDMINQVEYDKAVNDFVNDTWNVWPWQAVSKASIRTELNDRYIDSFWERFGNTLAISQWAISTDSAEENMTRIKSECEQNIKNYLEALETAEANWAQVSADAQALAKENALASVDIEAQKQAIADSETAISSAEDTITGARSTYNEASERLEELKDIVKSLEEVKNISLDEIKEKLAKAEQEVATAKDNLDKAYAAEWAAKNYSVWAQNLLEEQQVAMYRQLTGDEANDDVPFELVPGKDDDFAKAPYSIYRAYVERMYEEYSFYDEENFNVIATEEETMKVLFWEMDKDGVLTGNYYDDKSKLPKSGKYFIGNTFGFEKMPNTLDGIDRKKLFRMDGVVYKYTKPNPNNNIPGNNGGNNGNNSDNNETNNGNGGTNTGANETVINTVADAGNGTGANGTGTGRGTGRLVDSVDADEEGIADLEEDAEEEKEAAPDENLEKEKESEGNKGTVEIDENETPLSATAEEESAFPWMVLAAALLLAATVVVVCASRKKVNTADAKAKIK